MKKFTFIIILIILQVLSFVTLSHFGYESLFGVWAFIYFWAFITKFFNLEGLNSAASKSYDSIKGMQANHELEYGKRETVYSVKYIDTKWYYLTLTAINLAVCLIMINLF